MKNNSGFSLVELIVVIAIMAILAGVAVPTYTKYITKANDAKVVAELDEIKTAAIAAGAAKGIEVKQIDVETSSITVSDPSGKITQPEVLAFLDGGDTFSITLTNTSYEKGATWYATGDNAGWNPQAN